MIVLFIIILIVLSAINLYFKFRVTEEKDVECVFDKDCVPAGCCHPNTCTGIDKAPECDGISCTMNCEPETLDCNQGACLCVENKCQAAFT